MGARGKHSDSGESGGRNMMISKTGHGNNPHVQCNL